MCWNPEGDSVMGDPDLHTVNTGHGALTTTRSAVLPRSTVQTPSCRACPSRSGLPETRLLRRRFVSSVRRGHAVLWPSPASLETGERPLQAGYRCHGEVGPDRFD